MPDWLVSVLIQYPIVVVIGFVAWYAYKELKDAHIGRLRREEESHANSIAQQKEFHQLMIEAKNLEIGRLKDEHRKDVDKLTKKLDELIKRLGS